MTPAQRLVQREYPAEWGTIADIYHDAMDSICKERKPNYNPKAEHVYAKQIWEHVGNRYENPILRIDAIADVISKACADYDKAIRNPKVELSRDDHCYPFCQPELPTLKKLAQYWTECWAITVKGYRKGEDTRVAAEGREKFARDAEAARQADERAKAEFKPAGEPGIAERAQIDRWSASHQEEYAALDQAARRLARWKFVAALDTEALITLRRGFVYCFWLVEMENAIFGGKPIRTPEEMKARLAAQAIPKVKAKQAVQSAGVETNQTEQTQAVA